MSESSSPAGESPNPPAPGSPTGPDAAAAEPGADPSQAAPGAEAADKADDIYDQAFEKLLGPNAGSPPATAPATPGSDPGAAESPDAGEPGQAPDPGAELSDDQVQLLRRLHMSPDMIAAWSPEQQRDFLDNAAKREADQTRSFKQLREQAQAAGKPAAEGKGEGKGEAGQQSGQEAPPASELGQQTQKVLDDLVDVYGEEIKPLGELTSKLVGSIDQLQQRLTQSETSSSVKDQLIVEMTIDSGMRDLVGEFPSLDKADVRERVVERFEQDWRSPESKHRQAQGPLLQRVRAALRDAASAEFGPQTESAAQVALANKTKERLRNQPQPGAGRGRPVAQTADDVYDQAYDEHLAPELNHR